MPNVGWGELLLILLVALVVFGPRRLPEMMRSLGKALRAFQDESQRAVDQFRVATTDEGASEHGVVDRPDGWVPGATTEEASTNGAGTTRRGTGSRARSRTGGASSRTSRSGSGARSGSAKKSSTRATAKRDAPKRTTSKRSASAKRASTGAKRSAPAKRSTPAQRTKRTAPREPYEDT